MSKRRLLFSWIGHADLRAMAATLPLDQQAEVLKGLKPPEPLTGQPGPLKCLLDHEAFDEVHLLSDHAATKDRPFVKWLGGSPILHNVKIANPIDYAEIFRVVDAELASWSMCPMSSGWTSVCTSAPARQPMTATWVLLGKSKYRPTTFYQTHNGRPGSPRSPSTWWWISCPKSCGTPMPSSSPVEPEPPGSPGLRENRRQ